MKIILNKDIPSLGEEGDIKVVADGYARNYLLPQNFAIAFNKANVNTLEQRKEIIERRKEEKRKVALSLKEKLEAAKILLKMPAGENGRLFGAVTNASIADALSKEGIIVDKKTIEVPDHTLKSVGNYSVTVKLYKGENATLAVAVEAAE